MKSLLATERPAGYELRGKGSSEAERRDRFGVCQVRRGMCVYLYMWGGESERWGEREGGREGGMNVNDCVFY